MGHDYDSSETQTELPSPHIPPIPPITNNHVLLPLPGGRYAPRTLTFKGQEHELAHFLDVYSHLCAHYQITSSRERCKGIIPYCTSKVVKMIKKLPSFVTGDFRQLVKDLYYFLDEEDDTYNSAKVETFTRKWRKQKIESLEQFKRYHRKYLELVGKAIGSQNMSNQDFNRYFWEGIHRSLRRRIEDRMLVADPDLDVSTPFEMSRVVKAGGYIFNRHRFDQHLLGKSGVDSSDSETEEESYPTHRIKYLPSDSEDDKKEDSDDSDVFRKTPLKRKRRSSDKKPPPKKEPSPKKELHPKKIEGEDISKLAQKMGQLSLTDPRYRAFYADIVREELEKQRPQPFALPPNQENRYRRDSPPHQDPQSNRTYGQPQGPPQRYEYPCYGCGEKGHPMTQCGALNELLNQRTIVRRDGRLQWPDGSPIRRDKEEPWVQAVERMIKRANIVRADLNSTDEEEEEEPYHYVGVAREEEDASSEEQQELGWFPGQVGDYYALGVERNPRVSRDARKQVQFHPPGNSQGMKDLPERRNAVGPGNQGPPIHQTINNNRYQPGTPKRITPLDVHQGKFEAKRDDQFLPMDVDKGFIEVPRKETKKIPTNQGWGDIVKVPNPRANSGRTSLEIVQDIMQMPLTITLEEAVNISPTMRRDLTSASRPQREALAPISERKEKTEKIALGANLSKSLQKKHTGCALGDPRDDLLKVPATVGRAKITAVFDSGSQVNVLSDRWLRRCGLPVSTEGVERYRISGVNGGLARCIGRIPNARIYLTDSELETVGDLIVVEECGFDLLLGRPWATVNGAGLREAMEGTYLSFNSEGCSYEVNVSPNPNFEEKIRGFEVALCTVDPGGPPPKRYAVATGKRVSVPDASDSGLESDLQNSESEEKSDRKPAQLRPPDWTQAGSDNEDFESGGQFGARREAENDEDRCWLDNPASTREFKGTARSKPNASLIIETDLQESYIKMVQKGVDEEDWQRFCTAEKMRRRKDKNQWKGWKEEKDEMNLPGVASPKPETPDRYPPEPTMTLATPEPAQRPKKTQKRMLEDESGLVTMAARRSQRVRRESQRARDSDDWQKWRQKVYEREEKLTRKTVKSREDKTPGLTLSSLGARLSIHKPGKKSKDQLSESEFDEEDEPIIIMDGSSELERRLSQETDSLLEGPWQEPQGSEDRWIAYGRSGPGRNEGRGILRTRAEVSPREWEAYDRCQYIRREGTPEEARRDNRLHRPYDETTQYPWVSSAEMEIIKEWISYLYGSSSRRFFVYNAGRNTVCAALIPEGLALNAARLKEWETQRIVTLSRGSGGILTRIPHHTVACALFAQQANVYPCSCPPVDTQVRVHYPASGRTTLNLDESLGGSQKAVLNSMGPPTRVYACLAVGLGTQDTTEDPVKPKSEGLASAPDRGRIGAAEENQTTNSGEPYVTAEEEGQIRMVRYYCDTYPEGKGERQEPQESPPTERATPRLQRKKSFTDLASRSADQELLGNESVTPEKNRAGNRSPSEEFDIQVPETYEQVLTRRRQELASGILKLDKELAEAGEKEWRVGPDRELYDERAYQCGKIVYVRKELVGPGNDRKDITVERPFDEVPEWDLVLGRDGIYRPQEEYPVIGREEVRKIIDQLECSPINRGGGKHYLLYKKDDGALAVILTHDDRAATPHPQEEKLVMTLDRRISVTSEEIDDSSCKEAELTGTEHGRPGNPVRLSVPVNPTSNTIKINGETPWDDDDDSPIKVAALRPPTPEEHGQTYTCSCMMVSVDGGIGSEPPPSEEGDSDGREDAGGSYGMEEFWTEEEATEDDILRAEALPGGELADEIHQNFPRAQVNYLPIMDDRSNGVLAAIEVIPIAQYADREDYEFYARGVTLAMDDEDQEVTYYRGNALIRISGNDGLPKLKTPARLRVNHARHRLFRMGQFSLEKEEESRKNEPIPCREDRPPEGNHRPTPDTHETTSKSLFGNAKGQVMTPEEIAAIVDELVERPIKEVGEKRAYAMIKMDDGIVIAMRVPLNIDCLKDDAACPGGDRTRDEAVDDIESAIDEFKDLSLKGSDPPASDHAAAKARQAEGHEKEDWDGNWPEEMEDFEPQQWGEIPDEINKGIECLATDESIKRTEGPHQGNLPTDDSSTRGPQNISLNDVTPSPPCLQPMGTTIDLPEPPPRELRSLSAAFSIGPVVSPACQSLVSSDSETEEDLIEIPALPSVPRPGIVAATHLALLQGPGYTLQEPSFFGFGATVVYEDDEGHIQSHRGHAIIHIVNLDLARTFHFPPPPPRSRAEAARAYLFQAQSVFDLAATDDPRTRPARMGDLLPPLSTFRFNPATPEFDPRTKTPVTVPTNSPIQTVDDRVDGARALVAAKTLVAMKVTDQPNIPRPNPYWTPIDTPKDPVPEEPIRLKIIKFEHGGTIPGTFDSEQKAGLKIPIKKASTTSCLPPKDPVQDEQKQDHDDEDSTHSDIDELDDVEMDYIEAQKTSPADRPLLQLTYPMPKEGMGVSPNEITDGSALKSIKIDLRETQDEPIVVDGPEIVICDEEGDDGGENEVDGTGEPQASAETLEWRQNLADLRIKLKNGTKWTEADAQEIFGSLGLLQWWYDIRQEEEAGREPDWKKWKERVVEEWRRRYPKVADEEFQQVADNLQGQEKDVQSVQSLLVRVGTGEREDVEMEKADAPSDAPKSKGPRPLQLPPDPWVPGHSLYPRMPETDEIGELKSRLADLEDQFVVMGDDLRTDLTELRDSIHQDGITLSDLQWRLEHQESREHEGGKRAYRKAKAKGPSHRYPTRYSAEHGSEPVEPSKKTLREVEEKIRKIEGRQERTQREIARIESDLTVLEEMSAKIDALATSLEDFKTAQVKINVGILKEIVKLKALYSDTVDPKLTAHTGELALLTARFHMLQAIAGNLIANRTATTTPTYTATDYKQQPPPPFPLYPNSFPYAHQNQRVPAV